MKQEPLHDSVRSRLDAVVHAERVERVPELVKAILVDSMQCGSLAVPASFRRPIEGTYARRLLHRDPEGQYTIVVMTWGPGQKTALHDHAGIWCVEGVVEGRMDVTQYDLVEDAGAAYRFEAKGCVHAAVGSAGCLIPPFEYHVLANALDVPSVTLHIYGGEMDHCHAFEPLPDGAYGRTTKMLSYSD